MIHGALRIAWHEITCVAARAGASTVFVGPLGRSYECGCGYGFARVEEP
jgi:hypothetical protein